MSKSKKSKVWIFFKDTENNTKAECVLCKALISRGGTGKAATTTSLINHIKGKHPESYKELNGPIHNPNNETIERSDSPVMVQQNIKDYLHVWDINDNRAKELHYSIAEMIAVDNQPVSIVDDIGFTRLMKKMKPRYKIPSRKYMTDVIIPNIYKKTKDVIRKNVLQAAAISATTDMWTDNNNTRSFLSFTAHWLTDDFVPKHCVLQMKHFTGQHSGDNIRKVLSEITTLWEIPEVKVHVVLRDNGANIVKALNDSSFTPIPCFIHTLQLVINDAIIVQKNVNDMISASRRIVTHFHHSDSSQEKLRSHQQELGLPPHQLVQDVRTRWNSTYYMLARLLEQKRPITLYISENDVNFDNLTLNQWQLLEECLLLLKPFEEVTKIVSSSIACISEIIPTVNTLIKYLSKEELILVLSNVSQMRLSLINGMQTRFCEIERNKYYFLATLLDPRYRMQFFSLENIPVIRQSFFLEALRRELSSESSSDDDNDKEYSEQDKQKSPSSIKERNIEQAHTTFWDCYKEIASSVSFSMVTDNNPKSSVAIELDAYLSGDILSKDHSPFLWWKKYYQKFPKISQLAKIYLSAPASTVYSERLFSEAGNIYENKRNRLLPERAENLVFLHHNLPLIDYNYIDIL